MNIDKSNSATLEGTDKIVISRQDIAEYTCTLEKLSDYVESNIPAPAPFTLPYKSYVATVTQTGTAAPVATVLENTLGAVPVWSRDSSFSGVYYLTLTGAFPANKTVYNTAGLSCYISGIVYNYNIFRLSDNIMEVDAINGDSTMVNAIIEIRVYN